MDALVTKMEEGPLKNFRVELLARHSWGERGRGVASALGSPCYLTQLSAELC